MIQRGQAAGKPLLYCDLYTRHRLYFANIFLQHLDVAEAITPFHSWDVINLRTNHDQARCFGGNNYLDLFPRHFPALRPSGTRPHSFPTRRTSVCVQALRRHDTCGVSRRRLPRRSCSPIVWRAQSASEFFLSFLTHCWVSRGFKKKFTSSTSYSFLNVRCDDMGFGSIGIRFSNLRKKSPRIAMRGLCILCSLQVNSRKPSIDLTIDIPMTSEKTRAS